MGCVIASNVPYATKSFGFLGIKPPDCFIIGFETIPTNRDAFSIVCVPGKMITLQIFFLLQIFLLNISKCN